MIAPRFVRRFFPPGTKMHLINTHRRTQQVTLAPLFQPISVAPFETLRVPDNRGVFGRHFEEKSIRVGLQRDVSTRVANFEFVMRALPDIWNENFPNTGCAEQTHGMKPPIPMVEITDDADALRVWRPNGETGAVDAVNHAQLRAEFFVNAPLVAFAEQKQIRFAQRRQK